MALLEVKLRGGDRMFPARTGRRSTRVPA